MSPKGSIALFIAATSALSIATTDDELLPDNRYNDTDIDNAINFSDDTDSRFIINNSAGSRWNNRRLCTISNIIDAGPFGSCTSINDSDGGEFGNISIQIRGRGDMSNLFYWVETQKDLANNTIVIGSFST